METLSQAIKNPIFSHIKKLSQITFTQIVAKSSVCVAVYTNNKMSSIVQKSHYIF